ncbi:ABC transporter permease [Flavicella sediminum]|uniref:ABC transporter permease n=1 Tax=Flavicella sediminum TaxID=2585141 RepID=UPI00112355BC|nr:ABC transporter permease [Flavicella sediminum]
MEKLKLIIYREFIGKVRNKSFIILTFLSPVLMIGMGLLIFYLTKVNNNSAKEIAYVNESSLNFEEVFVTTKNTKYIDVTQLGVAFSKEEIDKGHYYGLVTIPSEANGLKELASSVAFYSKEAPSILFLEHLEKLVANKLKAYKLKELGISQKNINAANFAVNIKQSNSSGEKSSKLGNGLKIGLGMGSGYLLMMFIIIYGNSVMRNVIEEKTSRIIEIIISSVKPFQLMLGKIIGNACAGLLQFFVWIVLLLILGTVVSLFVGVEFGDLQNTPSKELMQESGFKAEELTNLLAEILALPLLKMFVLFIFYFIGGFFLYSSIYAAIGAAVDSETDTQQFMMPVIMPLMLAVYIGFASVLSDPNGPVATIFSIIPFTSSIVMLMRIPFGVPWWELLLSLLLLTLSFVGMVWVAAKIYRVGILMYGKKPTYKDLYKWLKY